MPESKKRKRKNGKKVGNGHAGRIERLDNVETGVTLQDLINAMAYQQYVEEGKIADTKVIENAELMSISLDAEPNAFGESIDFSDPDTQAVIKAVDSINIDNKEQD